jgi:hypothetical protein
MSKNLHTLLISNALIGLLAGSAMLTACGGTPNTEPETAAEPTPAAEEATPAATEAASAEGDQAAKAAGHACKGMNECKGMGGCAVEGANGCTGHNDCKGAGGCCTLAEKSACPSHDAAPSDEGKSSAG